MVVLKSGLTGALVVLGAHSSAGHDLHASFSTSSQKEMKLRRCIIESMDSNCFVDLKRCGVI